MIETQAVPADLLGTIVAGTRRIVQVRTEREPFAELAKRAEQVSPRPGIFRSALSNPARMNVIAECKRRSPSRGVLRPIYDASAIARSYEMAGAAAISVLTEPTFFDGSLQDLAAVRSAVGIPVLRKDFVVSEYQIAEARASGADAVLLIVAALSPTELKDLLKRAEVWALDVLVEVHDEGELHIAEAAGAAIVGVNNRNLRTLQVDVEVSKRLVARIPNGAVAVAESGIRNAGDLVTLGAAGYHACLIGERFMTEADPGRALRELTERARERQGE